MEYLIHIAVLISLYSIVAIGVNLIVGYTGLLSVGQVIYSGIGAYAIAILQAERGWNFFLAALFGIAVAIVVALLIGLVLSKFSGDYYALVTVGFNVIFVSAFLSWGKLTRGSFGVPGIGRPHLPFIDLSINFNFLIFTLAILLVIYALTNALVKSSFGRVLKAIREDQKTTQVFGYKVFSYKLWIYIVAAIIAAIAGTLYASYLTYIDPFGFTVLESIFTLSIVILGGLANLKASILGAAALVVLPEALRFVGFPSEVAAQMRNVIYGLVLIVLMLYRPQGLLGEYKL